VIKHFGGLHRFMNWNGPILTDSGGYQIFSLAKLRRITEEGVHFQNHVDGTPAFISPEIAIETQGVLGSDIAMVLDECPPWPCERDYAARSLEMTTRWAKRCKEANAQPRMFSGPSESRRSTPNVFGAVQGQALNVQRLVEDESAIRNPQSAMERQLLFGIVQGATFADLRQQSAQSIVELDFDGYAIGGVSVGEPEEEMMRAVDSSEPSLPGDKPRYVMGLGTPPQLLELIGRGIDLFDCVLPTRLARNGTAFTSIGTLNLKNAEYALDKKPIEEGCQCPSCREFTRGYIRHLVKAEEILGLRLITLHNLHFYLDLMRLAREAIQSQTFDQFRRSFVAGYKTREEKQSLTSGETAEGPM
jgi:queuine tRNA-ribosyltransferase